MKKARKKKGRNAHNISRRQRAFKQSRRAEAYACWMLRAKAACVGPDFSRVIRIMRALSGGLTCLLSAAGGVSGTIKFLAPLSRFAISGKVSE